MGKMLAAKIKTKEAIHRITGQETKQERAKRDFLKKYKHTSDPEILEMVNYIKQTGQFGMINKHLKNDWGSLNPDVKYDADRNLPYVLDDCRRIYWGKNMTQKEVGNQYKGIKVEQDPYSPHCYLNEDDVKSIRQFKMSGGKIISIECGAMEGMFTRGLIDLIDEAYMFECEKDWKEALGATFSEYQERTHIVSRYVSNQTNIEENIVSIDEYFVNIGGVNFDNTLLIVKMDIEGYEMRALEGMMSTLSRARNVMAFICAYHRQDDEKEICNFFDDGYDIGHTDGYFCFYEDPEYGDPYIRRCVMKIRKRRQ